MASSSATEEFPTAPFTLARHDKDKRSLPQCIAHRGYKATCPENSLLAFRAAIEVGAHAIETDIHITKDEVVVLSHDATLKRCFGKTDKIIDQTWEELKQHTTTRAPHVPIPRLSDLLDLLAESENEEVWCLLDIKMDNDAEQVMRLIASTIRAHSAEHGVSWMSRVVLGIWAAKFLPLCRKYLSDFPVVHIGFATSYARHFFKIDNIGFNMLFPMLVAPGGRRFLHDAKHKYHRQVIAWTVNTEDAMNWCIRHDLDGVITDDPKLFNEVRSRPSEAWQRGFLPLGPRALFDVIRLYLTVTVLSLFMGKRLRPVASKELVQSIR